MKREARGCGITCDCPRMKYDWTYYELAYNYINLVRDGFLTLDDVTDKDWDMMNQILVEEAFQKEIKQNQADKVREILG